MFCLFPVHRNFVTSEANERSYLLLLDVPLVVYSGRWAVKCSRACYTVLAFEGVIIGHAGVLFSVKEGTIAVRGGCRIHLVDFAGYTPQRFSQKRGLGCPLHRRGPVVPNTVPEKRKVCVLGMGCGRHGSASELNFRPFGVSAGTFRGRLISTPN